MGVLVTLLIYASACAFATAGRAAHVTLNEDGVLLIDGRKILPIGFTGGPPPDGRTPEGKPAFEEIRDAGGTFFRTGLQEGDRDKQLLLRSVLNRFRDHPGLQARRPDPPGEVHRPANTIIESSTLARLDSYHPFVARH